MRKILTAIILGALALYGYQHYRGEKARAAAALRSEAAETYAAPVAAADSRSLEERARQYDPPPESRAERVPAAREVEVSADKYRCDGRVYCSQMHSCEEATWFLQNCPGTKMDGEGDGVPCEKQWCGH